MAETTMTETGKQALARVLVKLTANSARPIDEHEAQTLTDGVWDDFKAAVAGARAELREDEAVGQQRWRDARHMGT